MTIREMLASARSGLKSVGRLRYQTGTTTDAAAADGSTLIDTSLQEADDAFNEMEAHIIKTPTFMEKINDAIAILENDRECASLCGTGLNEWKKIKAKRESEVKKLVGQAQLILTFDRQK